MTITWCCLQTVLQAAPLVSAASVLLRLLQPQVLLPNQAALHRLRHLPLQLQLILQWLPTTLLLQVSKLRSCCLHCVVFSEGSSYFNISCCAVTFSASLPSLSVATFQIPQQNDFKNAVISRAKGATSCSLTRWYDGSLQIESAVSFPKSDGSADNNAASFTNILKTDISSVFPSATYGAVKVGNVSLHTSKFKSSFAIGFEVALLFELLLKQTYDVCGPCRRSSRSTSVINHLLHWPHHLRHLPVAVTVHNCLKSAAEHMTLFSL